MADVARLDTRSLVDLMKQKNAEDAATAPTLTEIPAVRGAQWGIRNIAAGAALPFAAASDVVAKGLNAGNWALGGSADFFPTDKTASVTNFAAGVRPQPAAPSASADTFTGVPGSLEAVTDFKKGGMSSTPGSFETTGGFKPPTSTSPAAAEPAATEATPPVQGTGSFIKTLDDGKVLDASGQASGGFGMPESSRLKNVAINDARQAEMNAALDRSRLVAASDAVDLWRTKISQATTPFELQQAQAGLAGAQAQLTTLTGTKNAEVTGGFGLKGHEVVAQMAKEGHVEAARIAGEAKVDAAEASNSTEKAKLAADAKIKAAEIAANAPAVKEQAAADALIAGQLGIGLEQVKSLREAGGVFKKRSGFPGFRSPAGFYDAQGKLMDLNSAAGKKVQVGKYTVMG